MARNLLWAHLLRKDATSTDSPSQIPPIAPQDKTGTSVRMLIHDTHANLEKFSTRLDGLLLRVDDCRTQIINANKLLDVERDKVISEILEITNRCQKEMKAHVGTPAQAPALELVQVTQSSADKAMQALERRIDALQALLQTQAHTMQSIQDQQVSLMTTILPLVPLVHGVSGQMDHIKASLSEIVANAVSTMIKNFEDVRLSLVSDLTCRHKNDGSSTRLRSSRKPRSSPQQKRSNSPAIGYEDINVPVSSPLCSRGQRELRLGLKRTHTEATTDRENDIRRPSKLPRLTVPNSDPGSPTTPQTPRQPLSDLPLPSDGNAPRTQNHVLGHLNSTPRDCMRRSEYIAAAIPPIFEQAFPESFDASIHRGGDTSFVVKLLAAGLVGTAEQLDKDAPSKSTKDEEVLRANVTDVISIHSSPLSSAPSSAPLVALHEPSKTMITTSQASLKQSLHSQESVVEVQGVDPGRAPTSRSASSGDGTPPKSMSLRDRKAQMSRVGRPQTQRFIPIVPWLDEDE